MGWRRRNVHGLTGLEPETSATVSQRFFEHYVMHIGLGKFELLEINLCDNFVIIGSTWYFWTATLMVCVRYREVHIILFWKFNTHIIVSLRSYFTPCIAMRQDTLTSTIFHLLKTREKCSNQMHCRQVYQKQWRPTCLTVNSNELCSAVTFISIISSLSTSPRVLTGVESAWIDYIEKDNYIN